MSIFVVKYLLVANEQALKMMLDPENHSKWKHKWYGVIEVVFCGRLASSWAGEADWMDKRKRCEAPRT